MLKSSMGVLSLTIAVVLLAYDGLLALVFTGTLFLGLVLLSVLSTRQPPGKAQFPDSSVSQKARRSFRRTCLLAVVSLFTIAVIAFIVLVLPTFFLFLPGSSPPPDTFHVSHKACSCGLNRAQRSLPDPRNGSFLQHHSPGDRGAVRGDASAGAVGQ